MEEEVIIIGAGIGGLATAVALKRVGVRAVRSGVVCRLRKSLYGLRQASRNWYAKLADAMRHYGFRQSGADHSLFIFNRGNIFLAALVYVDDILVVGNNREQCTCFKRYLNRCFRIKDLGLVSYFLGIEVTRMESGLFLNQRNAFVTDVKTKSVQQVPYGANKRGGPKLVHRKTLLQALADELDPDTIRFSRKLTSIESQVKDGHRISVLGLEDGTIIRAKMVIGCDGVHSVIARHLKLRPPVHSGRSAVRGLSVYPEGHGLVPAPQQFVDVSKRAGFSPLNDKDVYWFFICKSPSEEENIENDPEAILRDVMENWAKDFPQSYLDVVQHSDLSTLSWAPLMFRYPWEVVLGNLNTENITVLGDAMHPTTPDLAQGGCMALEDAVVLGRHIGNSVGPDGKLKPEDVQQALGKYVEERRWRAAWIIAASFLSGWVQQDGSDWWRKLLRNVFYKTIFAKIISIAHYDCGRLPNKSETSN
ncbi:hypothetical protein CRG98_038339 [Punica granatum]|uniref:FAD-binding domain-containing protein n=1 Tax=Punica granatum TaxID=22663 RepID=A0A2I0IBB5_PUNGR|nr:hypothetical protein CRG98_038339 [Punica granatum]